MATRSALHLATVDAEGRPHASYAPFVAGDGGRDMYVFVSELSQHTGNLRATACASALLIEDEAQAAEAFARRRLVFECSAELVGREAPLWRGIVDRFEARFGEIVDTLRQLKDFVLFRLHPESGLYVKGFGQAYRIEGDDLDRIHHIAPRPL